MIHHFAFNLIDDLVKRPPIYNKIKFNLYVFYSLLDYHQTKNEERKFEKVFGSLFIESHMTVCELDLDLEAKKKDFWVLCLFFVRLSIQQFNL